MEGRENLEEVLGKFYFRLEIKFVKFCNKFWKDEAKYKNIKTDEIADN